MGLAINPARRPLFCIGSVLRYALLQSPAIALAKTVIFWSCFRPPIFRRPWADFRETLPHNAVGLCPEIVYLL